MTEKTTALRCIPDWTGTYLEKVTQASQVMLSLAYTYSQGPCIVVQSLPGTFAL